MTNEEQKTLLGKTIQTTFKKLHKKSCILSTDMKIGFTIFIQMDIKNIQINRLLWPTNLNCIQIFWVY